jgi:peptide/nickel transport system substrate-binding protein
MKRRKLFAVLLSAVMAMSLLVGCGGDGSSGSSGETADDTIYLRLMSPLESTDWQQTSTLEGNKITYVQLFEGLYGIDESEGGYYDLLAKNVDVSEDGLTYTIELVDATFQNGDTVTADDVVFSYEMAMNNAKFGYVTSMIDTVTAQDDKTVVITLKYPYSAIDHTFFTVKITSQREYEEIVDGGGTFGTAPHKAGTGPYYVEEYDVASGVKLTAYEDYWQGAPDIKHVGYRVIAEDAAAVIAYENGELDYITDAPLTEWENIEAAAGDRCELVPANDIQFLAINYKSESNNGILSNPKVREAIFYAINKDDIVLSSTTGYGSPAYEYMLPEYVPTSPNADDGGFKTYDYDEDAAHQCLLDAGFTEEEIEAGIPVGTILTYPSDNSPKGKAAVVIQENLRKNGMIAEVEIKEASPGTIDMYNQNYDMAVYSDSGNYDYNNIRQQLDSESTGMYIVSYKDDNNTFDWQYMEDLIDQGVAVTDTEERVGIYTELWDYVMNTQTILPLYHSAVGIAWSDRIDVSAINPTYYHLTDMSWA